MRKAVVLLLPVLLGAFAVAASAQIRPFGTPTRTPTPTPSPTPTPPARALPCPQVNVQPQGPPQVKDGQPIFFQLNIAGGDPKVQPTILWSTNAGLLKSGQGERRIEVDTTGAGATDNRELKAEVWVGGYANECLLQASARIKIIPPATKIGEVPELAPDIFANMLKVLGESLGQSQDNIFVFAYAGRKSERGYAMNWTKKIRDELSMTGLNPRRITAVDGGFREEPAFEYWTVPPGAEPPRPTPTVRREEIVYPKATPTPPPKRP